jgi:hypothetical protein
MRLVDFEMTAKFLRKHILTSDAMSSKPLNCFHDSMQIIFMPVAGAEPCFVNVEISEKSKHT